jgi:hypothetical protein
MYPMLRNNVSNAKRSTPSLPVFPEVQGINKPEYVTSGNFPIIESTYCQGKLFTSDSSVGEIQEKETWLEGLYL